MRVFLVGLLLFALPIVSAGDPGAREPLDMDATVTAVDLAIDNGLIALGTQDPGSRFAVPQAPNEDTWFIYSKNGQSLLQEDDADPTNCATPPSVDDCQTHVTDMAIDRNGQRVIVAAAVGQSGSPTTVVAFGDRVAGPAGQFNVDGTVSEVAMNDAGTAAVVVTADSAAASEPRGNLYFFSWTGTTPVQSWSDSSITAAPTDVSISPDGTRVAVAAGEDHYRWTSANSNSEVRDNNFPGTANDVAMSMSTRHVSIGVSSEGWFQLYDDTTTAGQRELRARDEETPLQAAAIRQDGTAFAVGNSQGDVWVYGLDPDLVTLDGLKGKIVLAAGITDLEFSQDGLTLVIAEGTKVHQYSVNETSVAPLWSKDLGAGALGKVATDATGSMVISSVGDKVHIFDAIHDVEVDGPAETEIEPAETETIEVVFTNTGNRLETIDMEVDGPDGWSVLVDRSEGDVAPGDNVTLTITVTVPAFTAPGDQALEVTHTLASQPTEAVTTGFDVSVPSRPAWSIEAVDAASKDIDTGGKADFIVRVSNLGNEAGIPDVELEVDEAGWDVGFATLPGNMPPGQVSEFTVEMTAPSSAGSGDSATATLTFDGAQGSPLELSATVDARFGVEIVATPGSLTMTPENETTINILVRNTGNAPDSYSLGVEIAPQWFAGFADGASSIVVRDIPAQGTQTVSILVRSPDQLESGSAVLEVTATSLADDSKKGTDSVDLSMEEEEEEDEGGGGENGSPFPPIAFVLAGLLVAVFIKRRS